MKKRLSIFMVCVLIIPIAFILGACSLGNKNSLKSVDMNTSRLVSTQKVYYVGDTFAPSKTYVNLVYRDYDEKIEYTLKDYSLIQLRQEIRDLQYVVSGFDTSAPVSSQKVTISFTSEKYSGSVSTSFYIEVQPEYIATSEVENSELYLKSQFSLNETLDLDNMWVVNTYNNGRTERVKVEQSMVSGFDTSKITATPQTMTIVQNGKTITHQYVVAPSNKYKHYSKSFVKCFVPAQTMGYAETQYTNGSVFKKTTANAELTLAYYDKFNYTQANIKSRYSDLGTVSFTSFSTQTLNNVSATVCKFKISGYSSIFSAIYYDARFTVSTSSGLVTKTMSVEIVFADYNGTNNDEMTGVWNTLLQSITL